MQIDDIVNKVFNRSFMGYDMREVDAFLDDIIDKLERYESERREMLTAMEYLLDKLEKGGTLPESKRSLPACEEPEKKRGRGPRMIRSPKKEKRLAGKAAGAEAEAENAVAVELELESDAPGVEELFPEIFEALAALDIPIETESEDEKNAS